MGASGGPLPRCAGLAVAGVLSLRRRQHVRRLVRFQPIDRRQVRQLFGSKSQAVGEAPPPAVDN